MCGTVGHASANCTPDFVMFHKCKHQNTPFQSESFIFSGELATPLQDFSPGGRGIFCPNIPIPSLSPTKPSECALRP